MLADPVAGARLLAPDLPGFGESTGVRGFSPSMSRYAKSLIRFLDDLNAQRTVFVGHSFGAAVAVQLALAAPERFPAGKYMSLGNVGHSPRIEAPERVNYLLGALLDLTDSDPR